MEGFKISNANRFLESGQVRVGGELSSQLPNTSSSSGVEGKSFSETLKEAVSEVNELHKISNKKMQDLATGRTDNVADVMIAAEKADIALRVMVQMRNKIIDAYNEIMKMQV